MLALSADLLASAFDPNSQCLIPNACPGSRRVVAVGAEGVTAANAQSPPPGTAQTAVLSHRRDHVAAASGIVAAVRAEPGADQQLVQAHQRDQRRAGQPREYSWKRFA